MTIIQLAGETLADALAGIVPETLLTPHELDVARLLAGGANYTEIAIATGVTDRAVPYTVLRLLQKTRTRTEAHLVHHLMHEGKVG